MRNYRQICDFLHLDFKKFKLGLIYKIGVFLIFSIFVSLLINLSLGIICLLFLIPILFDHFNSLEKKYRQYLNTKEIALYHMYQFLINMLANKIILYNALKECLPYIDETLNEDIQEWIVNIEQDSSIQPFIQFSNHFENASIHQMVLLLYYAQENGNKIEMLEEMNQTVFRLQEDAVQIGLNIQIKKLESFSMIPLLLSAIIIILFSLFIFQTIGVENLV